MRRLGFKNRLIEIVKVLLTLSVIAIILFPIIWMLPAAFKDRTELFAIPNKFLPINWTFENFTKVFELTLNGYNFGSSLLATLFVTVVATALSLFINMMAGYVFARIEFPLKNVIWWYVLITMFIPGITILLTSIRVVNILNMTDTVWVLIIPGVVSAYNIFYFRQFFLSIPKSLEDAALLDGLGHFGTFWHIFRPMSTTPMIVIGISVFMGYWNSFMWPTLTISNNPKIAQVTQIIRVLKESYSHDYGVVVAASMISIAIPLVIYTIFQRKILEGIATTGLK
ncbi:MAG: carbohydrate ABC transporter permease [Oscillospiraceae bacterium]|nr:carbohydrate ABC transporter permease [Oscillospiraceae bacterium]